MSNELNAPEKKTLLLPILMITVGIGWLLSTLGIASEIHWVWTLGLGAVGVSTFAIGGLDKVTVVIGPFFIIASFLSILRQTGRLPFDVEVPVLVIVTGVLLLLARGKSIPVPTWAVDLRDEPSQSTTA